MTDVIPSSFGQHLLRRCSGEMKHLAMVLVSLFDRCGRV